MPKGKADAPGNEGPRRASSRKSLSTAYCPATVTAIDASYQPTIGSKIGLHCLPMLLTGRPIPSYESPAEVGVRMADLGDFVFQALKAEFLRRAEQEFDR